VWYQSMHSRPVYIMTSIIQHTKHLPIWGQLDTFVSSCCQCPFTLTQHNRHTIYILIKQQTKMSWYTYNWTYDSLLTIHVCYWQDITTHSYLTKNMTVTLSLRLLQPWSLMFLTEILLQCIWCDVVKPQINPLLVYKC